MKYLSANERLRIEIKRWKTRHKKEHVRLSVLIMLDNGFTHAVIPLFQGIDADKTTIGTASMNRCLRS
jgi:hypothetical protein